MRFEYVQAPISNTSETPAISVSLFETKPPVQDSAVATVSPLLNRRFTTVCSKLSTFTPYTTSPKIATISFVTGSHNKAAASFVPAFAVTRTNISPSFA